MRALVMAAGLGTRLKPLTDTLPKPLVPVGGRPMVEYVLDHLAKHEVSEAILNIHYLPELMRNFVNAWNHAGRRPHLAVQDESNHLLGSGGGLALAAPWLLAQNDCALVCNSDVLAEPDLTALVHSHRAAGRPCTLAVSPHPEAGHKFTGLKVEGDLVLSFEKSGEGLLLFPGFYAVSAAVMARMPRAGQEFSVVEKLWKPLASERLLGAYHYGGRYLDLGTVKDLELAEAALAAARG